MEEGGEKESGRERRGGRGGRVCIAGGGVEIECDSSRTGEVRRNEGIGKGRTEKGDGGKETCAGWVQGKKKAIGIAIRRSPDESIILLDQVRIQVHWSRASILTTTFSSCNQL